MKPKWTTTVHSLCVVGTVYKRTEHTLPSLPPLSLIIICAQFCSFSHPPPRQSRRKEEWMKEQKKSAGNPAPEWMATALLGTVVHTFIHGTFRLGLGLLWVNLFLGKMIVFVEGWTIWRQCWQLLRSFLFLICILLNPSRRINFIWVWNMFIKKTLSTKDNWQQCCQFY